MSAVRRAHEERLVQALQRRLGELQALPPGLPEVRVSGACIRPTSFEPCLGTYTLNWEAFRVPIVL